MSLEELTQNSRSGLHKVAVVEDSAVVQGFPVDAKHNSVTRSLVVTERTQDRYSSLYDARGRVHEGENATLRCWH